LQLPTQPSQGTKAPTDAVCPETIGVQRSESRGTRTAGSIKQAVTSLDGVVDGVGTSIVVDLPQAESNLGHLVAIVEGNVGCLDSHCCEGAAVCRRMGYATVGK
jgi:hypothetical protein